VHWYESLYSATALANLGITTIEMMPVAEFAGRYGSGQYAAAELLQALGAVVLAQVVKDLVFGWP